MDGANRAVYRRQITLLAKSILDYLKSPESQPKVENSENFDEIVEELTILLNRMQNAGETLRTADNNIASNVKAEECEKECEAIAEYKDKVITSVTRINVRLERIKALRDQTLSPAAVSDPPHENRQTVKLPKIELRKFAGGYQDWLPFWEQFKVLVHENKALKPSDKFSYLQSVLSGKAANSIAGFSPTASCYDAAISLLIEEYGDIQRQVDKQVQQLMSLNNVSSKNDVAGLRRLYNAVVSSSRSLAVLGISSSNYYVILKNILLKRLPQDLRIDYFRLHDKAIEDHKDEVDDDAKSSVSVSSSSTLSFAIDKSVKFLLKFIKQEIEALERAGVHERELSVSNLTVRPKLFKTAAGLLVPSDGKKDCLFCKTSTHYSDSCEGPMSVVERKQLLAKEGRCFKCTRRGHTARDCKQRLLCRKCSGRHVLAVCDAKFAKCSDSKDLKALSPTTNLCSTNSFQSNVYLKTASVFISRSPNAFAASLFVRLVIDSGSQRTYITENIASKLNLPVVDQVNIRILPFGSSGKTPVQRCSRVRVYLRSQHDNSLIMVVAVVVPEICVDTLPIPNQDDSRFSKFSLADSRQFGQTEGGISILIGSDFYWRIVSGKFERITDDLTAVHTKLGWTIHGPFVNTGLSEFESASLFASHSLQTDSFPENIHKMWDIETLGITSPNAKESEFEADKYVRRLNNRYETRLLWTESSSTLSSYREGAFQRFNGLIRKLTREPKRLINYDIAMRSFFTSGVAEMVPVEAVNSDKKQRIYYMPHRPVYREDKATTKLRIVFDASARSSGCASLNDHLDAGPNLLPDILKVLLNFRLGKVALVADIEKAFLQILLHQEDRDVHRFFWFKHPIETPEKLPPVQEFRMTRVTFGVKCSPFLLGAVIQRHLKEEAINFPDVCQQLGKSFYMDDLVTSVDDVQFAERLYLQSCAVMKRAGMNIRKWNSNNIVLREKIATKAEVPEMQKVLGIKWYCLTDELTVDLEPARVFMDSINNTFITKRIVLQLMARIFDPLEALAFEIVMGRKYPFRTYEHLDQMQSRSSVSKCAQLHIFADASPTAYGATAYLRFRFDDIITTKFVCSKNRLAPLKNEDKQLTLPKLELTAALIAARLCKYLIENLNIELERQHIFLWSDSKITLYWINGDIRRWNIYVANRVREIRLHTAQENWRHCPGELNPADFLTKETFGKTTSDSTRWLCGPSWLSHTETEWPTMSPPEVNYDSALFSLLTSEVHAKADNILMKTPLDV